MEFFDTQDLFTLQSTTDFTVEPAPKYIEQRGYIYLLRDKVFPDHIKIGRTSNLQKRLAAYNADKPYPTTSVICISRLFENAIFAEKKILEYLYENTEPTTFTKEWFESCHKDLCIKLITEAEKTFS